MYPMLNFCFRKQLYLYPKSKRESSSLGNGVNHESENTKAHHHQNILYLAGILCGLGEGREAVAIY